MPLLDHFHPPLSRTHPWRGFDGAWAAAMARLLNAGVLPDGYYAVPFLDRDGPVEIDVAALREFEPAGSPAVVAGTQWTPSAPSAAVAVPWRVAQDVRVAVCSDEGDPRLAAAIELVSPRNKDRPSARAAFAAKSAETLRQGHGLVIVDAVTTRRADLHADLLAALDVQSHDGNFGTTAALAYRATGRDTSGQLQVWRAELTVGQSLPTVPLWLGAEQVVPLDLEASHAAACADLRIRHAG